MVEGRRGCRASGRSHWRILAACIAFPLAAYLAGKHVSAQLSGSALGEHGGQLEQGATAGTALEQRASAALDRYEEAYLSARSRDRTALLAIKNWPEFYRIFNTTDFPPHELEAMLIARLSAQWSLSEQQARMLGALVVKEQGAVTAGIVGRYGRDHLNSAATWPTGRKKALVARLTDERELIRRGFDEAYEALVGVHRMDALNSHLRSRHLEFVHGGKDGAIWVRGVGPWPSTDAVEVN